MWGLYGAVADLVVDVAGDVLVAFARVWPFLLLSAVLAAVVSISAGTDRISAFVGRHPAMAVGGAVLVATLTPFCSCGTIAVLLGMMAACSPWAPLVAFVVVSPLTSPTELVFSAGLFGWPFALVFFVGTMALGVAAGGVTALIERSGLLAGQARFGSADSAPPGDVPAAPGARGGHGPTAGPSLGPGAVSVLEHRPSSRLRLERLGSELLVIGRRMAVYFFGFTALGYLVIEAIPTDWLVRYLGGDSPGAVVLAALVGFPAAVNTEGSLPLVAALMQGGMGPGPALAFLVTGAGTSLGAVSGLLVIARRRVVALVIGLLFAGAIVIGWFGSLFL